MRHLISGTEVRWETIYEQNNTNVRTEMNFKEHNY